jgi:hypothetical protein
MASGKLRFSTLVLCSTAFLAACGSGGGGGSDSSAAAATPTSITGSVIDGYIKGAKVCLDVNSNAKCDAGEPTVTSEADGSYKLTYTGSIAGMHVIAEVPVGATDSDLGTIATAYSLLAPAQSAATDVHITPLTTMVSSEMIANKSSAADAEKAVKANLNLSAPTLLGYDFKKANDDSSLKVAQVTAAAIASVSDSLTKDATVKSAGLSSGDIVMQAVAQVKAQVMPQVIKTDGSLAMTGTTAQARAIEIAAAATVTLSGKIDNIVAASKSGEGSVVDLAAVFKTGLLAVENSSSGDYYDAKGVRINGNYGGYKNALNVEYIKFDVATITESPGFRKVLVTTSSGSDWYKRYEGGENWVFDGTTWVLGGNDNQSKPVIDKNCVSIPQTKSGGAVQTYCAVSKDLSGKKITDFIPTLCKSDSGTISGCDSGAVFPAKSIAYDLTMTVATDQYHLWADLNTWNGYATGKTSPYSSSIYDFISFTKDTAQFLGSGCSTAFKVKSYDTTKKTGVMSWAATKAADCAKMPSSYSFTEDTSFSVVAVGGKDIVKLETANLYRVNNGDNRAYTIFGYQKGSKNSGIWNGEFQPANYKQSIPFTGDPKTNTQVVSPTVLDAVLAQQKAPKFPYPN